MYKNPLFSYILTKTSENVMKKGTISFAIATRRVKCLVMNLTKDVKNLHTKNYKVLLKEIVKDTIKWKDILFS